MNINKNLTDGSDAQCCVEYCTTTYNVTGQEVVNNYRCNQPSFSTSDLWRLRKNKTETRISTNLQ